MRKYGAQRDTSEHIHVKDLRALGWTPLPFNVRGWPDLYAVKDGRAAWLECKELGEPFTPDQIKTFTLLHSLDIPIWILSIPGDAQRFNAGDLQPWTPKSVRKVWSAAGGRKSVQHVPGKSRARAVSEQCREPGCATSSREFSNFCVKHGKVDAVPPARKR